MSIRFVWETTHILKIEKRLSKEIIKKNLKSDTKYKKLLLKIKYIHFFLLNRKVEEEKQSLKRFFVSHSDYSIKV